MQVTHTSTSWATSLDTLSGSTSLEATPTITPPTLLSLASPSLPLWPVQDCKKFVCTCVVRLLDTQATRVARHLGSTPLASGLHIHVCHPA